MSPAIAIKPPPEDELATERKRAERLSEALRMVCYCLSLASAHDVARYALERDKDKP